MVGRLATRRDADAYVLFVLFWLIIAALSSARLLATAQELHRAALLKAPTESMPLKPDLADGKAGDKNLTARAKLGRLLPG